MRWKVKEPKPEPKHGEVREFDKFAFLPIKGTDGYWHWMETLTIVEKFKSRYDYGRETAIAPFYLPKIQRKWEVVKIESLAMERY